MSTNYRPILLGEAIHIDIETKGLSMSNTETKVEKPKINIGDLDIELDVSKGSDRFIITKRYKGSKLFYKKHRRACSSYLSKGTHFDTLAEAQAHFDTFIKSNWKHTKQFQIEPVSNFFISDWRLVVNYNTYGSSYDLSENNKVVLKNVPISIDDYKRGKKVTTVKELLEKLITESRKNKDWNERTINDYEIQIRNANINIQDAKNKIANRTKRLEALLKSETVIDELIEQNTTEAERTVKLFYGKE